MMNQICKLLCACFVASLGMGSVGNRARAETTDEILDRLEAAAQTTRTIHMHSKMTVAAKDWLHESQIETWLLRGEGNPRVRTVGDSKTTDQYKDERLTTYSQDLRIIDGTYQWSQQTIKADDGDRIKVTKKKVTPNAPLASIRIMCAQGQVIQNPFEELLGQRCAVIEVVIGEGTAGSRTMFWISEECGALLQMTKDDTIGSRTRMTVDSIEVNVPVDEKLFAYAPPPDVDVIDLDAPKPNRGKFVIPSKTIDLTGEENEPADWGELWNEIESNKNRKDAADPAPAAEKKEPASSGSSKQ